MLHVKSILKEFDLRQLINVPTQRCGHILDWVIIPPSNNYITNVQAVDKTISDHKLLIIDHNVRKPPKKVKKKCMPKLDTMKVIDTNRFKLYLQSVLRKDNPVCADSLDTALRGVLDMHAPPQTRKISEWVSAPWFNPKIKQAKQDQRKAERRWRKTGLVIHRQLFAESSRAVTHLIQAAKRLFYISKLEKAKTCKELFKFSDELLGKQKVNPMPSGTDSDVASKFLNFFDNKISSIRNVLDNACNDSPTFKEFNGDAFVGFELVTEDEVGTIIKNIVILIQYLLSFS